MGNSSMQKLPVCQLHTDAEIWQLIQPPAKCSSQVKKKSTALLGNNTSFAKCCLQLRRGIPSLGFWIQFENLSGQPGSFSIPEFHQGPDINQTGFDSYTKTDRLEE